MSAGTVDENTVLVIEAEDHLADLYTDYLSEPYDVRTAYGGVEGVEMLSADLDVVVVDRQLPVCSGNEVLAQIEERGIQCRVAIVTDHDPDFDIIEMGCDDYLVKPVTRDDLLSVVDRLMTVTEYDERMRELTAKKLRRNVLEVERDEDELASSEQFRQLQNEIAEVEAEIEDLADELGREDVPREL